MGTWDHTITLFDVSPSGGDSECVTVRCGFLIEVMTYNKGSGYKAITTKGFIAEPELQLRLSGSVASSQKNERQASPLAALAAPQRV